MEVAGRVERNTPMTSADGKLLCTPCKEEGIQESAEGYCEVCQELLCQACISCHRKFRMTKSHKILQGSDIPTKDLVDDVLDTSCTDVCEIHPGEFIKYYCENHDVIGCQPCTTINHRSCKLKFIPDLARTYKNSNEFKALIASLHEVKEQLSALTDQLKQEKIESERSYATTVEDIRRLRAEINDCLDKAEKKLLAEANRLKTENEKALQDMKEKHEYLHVQLIEMDERIKTHADKVSKLFIITRSMKADLENLKTECSMVMKKSNVVQYHFRASPSVDKILFSEVLFGELLLKNKLDTVMLNLEVANQITVVPSDSIRRGNAWITGLCLVSPDTLLTADYNNKALRLVDTSSQKIKSTLNLTCSPYDTTYLSDSQAAVTMPYNNKIQLVSTRGGLSAAKEIKVSGECRGICYADGKLVITYRSPGKLEMVSLGGTVYKTVTTDSKGQTLFTSPCYITFLNTIWGKYFYVTDDSTNLVTKLTIEGESVTQFNDQRLSKIYGIVPIGNSHIGVCNRKANKITMVCDKDENIEIIKELDCVRNSQAVEYSSRYNTLYVSSNSDGIVHVYKLSE